VSAQLGHANPATTLRYYAHYIPRDGDRWADTLKPDLGTKASLVETAGADGDAELRELTGESTGAGGESNPRPTDYESHPVPTQAAALDRKAT
jgi:hypothetical protein